MPAWGKTLNDAPIRDLVAFIRQVPAMSPQRYRSWSDER
jgi:mono/diheme cytochrome c family protein